MKKYKDYDKMIDVGHIGLVVKQENNIYYWATLGFDEPEWQEIPEYLYAALMVFTKESL